MEEINDQLDKFTGKAKLDKLKEQFKLLGKEIDKTKEKISIANIEKKELYDKLSGQGVKFNADGTISNYTQVYQQEVDRINAENKWWDSLSDKEKEKQSNIDRHDAAQERFDEFKKDISRYDELITDFIPGLQKDIQDKIDQQIEIKIEAFDMEIELRLELGKAERDWIEFKKTVIDGLKDDNILGGMEKSVDIVKTYFESGELQHGTERIQTIMDEIDKMKKGEKSQIFGDDMAAAEQKLRDAIDQNMESLTAIHEEIENMKAAYLSMYDEAAEKIAEHIELYDKLSSLINHDLAVIQLMFGEEAYGEMAKFYEEQKNNSRERLSAARQETDFWRKRMEAEEEGSDAWKKAKEEYLRSMDEEATALETYIQDCENEFLNSLNRVFQELNNKVTGGLGLAYADEQWNLLNKNADQYLDSINAIYSVQQLQNKYLESINSYDSVSAQSKLNELMEQEIGYLQEQDKLSQYDIDRAELKYQIALKQIALEEAQQNKSSMRLRRDSQGNYSYQYTADNDQMSKVRQEISDLYNQLYNLDSDQYKANLEELYSVWAEFQEKMSEAAQINDPEMRAQQELLIREQYGELINTLTEKNELTKSNLYNSTMSHLFELYDQNSTNYEMMTEEQRSILDNYFTAETEMHNVAFNNLFGLYDQNLDAFNQMAEIEKDILMSSVVPTWDSAIAKMSDTIRGEGGFETVCKDAFAAIDEAVKQFEQDSNEAWADYESRSGQFKADTQQFIEDSEDVYDKYQENIKAAKDYLDVVNSIVGAYDAAYESAKTFTEQAQKYWTALKNQQIDDATDPDVLKEDFGDNNIPEPKKEEPKQNNNSNPLGYASNGAPFIGTYTVKSGDNLSRIAAKYGISWRRIYDENKGVIGSNYNLIYPGQVYKIPQYASGGYTGDWAGNGGHLAMLHKKELVLNARDTENMLNAIGILRNITNGLNITMLNRLAGASANGFGGLLGDGITQNVHISAEFPNATSSREIEDALNNLVNRASQEIHKN